MKTQFYLARHGQTEWNTIKQLQGQLDSPLTAEGRTQAATLAERLKSLNITLLVSSHLGRAKATAEICQPQLNCPVLIHQGLQERHFGQWQGKKFADLQQAEQQQPQNHFEDIFYRVTEHAPPGGETGLACTQRFNETLIHIAHRHAKYLQYHHVGSEDSAGSEGSAGSAKIAIITHGDILRCFTAQLNAAQFCDAYSQYGNTTLFPVMYDHQTAVFTGLAGVID